MKKKPKTHQIIKPFNKDKTTNIIHDSDKAAQSISTEGYFSKSNPRLHVVSQESEKSKRVISDSGEEEEEEEEYSSEKAEDDDVW